jgi:putative transposase
MIRLSYKYRLYPTRAQADALDYQLAEACRLYNAALQERRDAWRLNRVSVSCYEQGKQLKEIRAAGDTGLVNYSCGREILRRVDRAFQAFFRRVKQGERAGFPRFKSARRFDSLTFVNGWRLESNKLRLQGVGAVKVKLHRAVAGKVKTVTVKREAGRWFVCFSVECEPQPLPPKAEAVGVDVGLTAFATLSDGTRVENPRWYRQAQARLRRAQRRVARRKKGSRRRRKAVLLLARVHAHTRNQRADFHHKVSRRLVNGYGVIAIEGLNVKGLAGGMLAKPVNDAGWSSFTDKLAYKAESAGRVLVRVDPRGTSQRCVCGNAVPKELDHTWHSCEVCGLSVSRDHAAALEILRLGLSLQALTYPVAECVA